MDALSQIRDAVESEIRTAFRGVTLGQGVSLRQARLASDLQDIVSGGGGGSGSPGHGAITNDWSQIPPEELETHSLSHLDALGFRYYIPALMLGVLNHYDPSSMRVIGTLSGLYPKKDSWEYHMQRYSLLNTAQKRTIARFLAALPRLVELDFEDQKIVSRALRNYWSEFLQADVME